jgi:hypothetical protein
MNELVVFGIFVSMGILVVLFIIFKLGNYTKYLLYRIDRVEGRVNSFTLYLRAASRSGRSFTEIETDFEAFFKTVEKLKSSGATEDEVSDLADNFMKRIYSPIGKIEEE